MAIKTFELPEMDSGYISEKDRFTMESVRKEVIALKMLRNTNIVQLYDAKQLNNVIFVIMELCDGGVIIFMLDIVSGRVLESQPRHHRARDSVLLLINLEWLQVLEEEEYPSSRYQTGEHFDEEWGTKNSRFWFRNSKQHLKASTFLFGNQSYHSSPSDHGYHIQQYR